MCPLYGNSSYIPRPSWSLVSLSPANWCFNFAVFQEPDTVDNHSVASKQFCTTCLTLLCVCKGMRTGSGSEGPRFTFRTVMHHT